MGARRSAAVSIAAAMVAFIAQVIPDTAGAQIRIGDECTVGSVRTVPDESIYDALGTDGTTFLLAYARRSGHALVTRLDAGGDPIDVPAVPLGGFSPGHVAWSGSHWLGTADPESSFVDGAADVWAVVPEADTLEVLPRRRFGPGTAPSIRPAPHALDCAHGLCLAAVSVSPASPDPGLYLVALAPDGSARPRAPIASSATCSPTSSRRASAPTATRSTP